MGSRGPTIVRINNGPGGHRFGGQATGSAGLQCCCCRCFTCIHFAFLKTTPGLLKILEIVIGSFCQSVALEYGMEYAGTMGSPYYGFLTTVSACLMTVMILLGCYILSEKSYNLIRQSLFETAFNGISALLYLSASSYLAFTVKTLLMPQGITKHQVYPAMSLVYGLGTVLGLIHGYDAYLAYMHYRRYQ